MSKEGSPEECRVGGDVGMYSHDRMICEMNLAESVQQSNINRVMTGAYSTG